MEEHATTASCGDLRKVAGTADPVELAARVKRAALKIGFEAAGICDLRPIERTALREWLARGYAGDMTYMHRQEARRTEPERIAAGAQRAVVVLKNHYQGGAPAPGARVARYAWGEDYHRVVGEKLRAIAEILIGDGSTPSCTRAYVDAGPVPERELAQRAGLGWIAKNTMLIRPGLGSFTFIGSVFTDLPLAVDPPFTADHCGRCRRCLDACPTDAFPAERRLDARRCISYLTIEYRRPFSTEQGAMVGDWLFGCDVCQDVCPWNLKFAPLTDEPRFGPHPELARPDPRDLVEMDAAEYRRRYADTAFERPGAKDLTRNARQVEINRNSEMRDR